MYKIIGGFLLVVSVIFNVFLLLGKQSELEKSESVLENMDQEVVILTGGEEQNIDFNVEESGVAITSLTAEAQNFEYNILDEAFERIKTRDDFKDFYEMPGTGMYFMSLKKLGQKDKWDKFVALLGEYHGEDFTSQGKIVYSAGNDVLDFTANMVNDFHFITSGNELGEIISYCSKFFETAESIQGCQDKVFFYRADSNNNLCKKISDIYKENLCNNFTEKYIK